MIGSFDLFFPSNDSGSIRDISYWEVNANLVYTLGLPLVPLTPYFGGGLNVARTDITDTTGGGADTMRTDPGVNLLAGAELGIPGLSPFVEFRYEIQGGEQWVLTGGILL